MGLLDSKWDTVPDCTPEDMALQPDKEDMVWQDNPEDMGFQGNNLDMELMDILRDTFHLDNMWDTETQGTQVGTACQACRSNMVWEDIL